MPCAAPLSFLLGCHPATPCAALRSVSAEVGWVNAKSALTPTLSPARESKEARRDIAQNGFVPSPTSAGAGWGESQSALHLRYTLHGDLAQLLIPPPVDPAPADGLWQHTCFEAFIGVPHDTAYREFNFSPSGQWAAYAFSTERVRDEAAESALEHFMPGIALTSHADTLSLEARLPARVLPRTAEGLPLVIGLSAVIEGRDRSLSYWALHHTEKRPDFHRKSGWIGRLSAQP